jgi:hypothetical protein
MRTTDEDYERLKAEFNDVERMNLSLAIGVINLWNRMQVGLRAVPAVEGAVGRARDAARRHRRVRGAAPPPAVYRSPS